MTIKPPDENGAAPYENLLRTLVGCIRSQPLLFMIAMGVLIVTLVIVGGGLGSTDLRFIVAVLGGLAVIGALTYYLFEARRMLNEGQRPPSDNPPPSA